MKLVVNNISKSIKGKSILANVSLEMEQGRVYGFVGRNGSGKTSCIKIFLFCLNWE